MCFVWIWEQTAVISLYSINWLVGFYNWDGVCLLRGTDWTYKFIFMARQSYSWPWPARRYSFEINWHTPHLVGLLWMSDRPVAPLHIIAVIPAPQGVRKSTFMTQKWQANEMTERKRQTSIPTHTAIKLLTQLNDHSFPIFPCYIDCVRRCQVRRWPDFANSELLTTQRPRSAQWDVVSASRQANKSYQEIVRGVCQQLKYK